MAHLTEVVSHLTAKNKEFAASATSQPKDDSTNLILQQLAAWGQSLGGQMHGIKGDIGSLNEQVTGLEQQVTGLEQQVTKDLAT